MAELRGGLLLRTEEAIGTIDSVNKTFTTSFAYIPTTIRVFLNGLEQVSPDDYVEIDSTTIEFVNAPIGGSDPDRVTVSYQRA